MKEGSGPVALFMSSFFGRGVARVRLNMAEGLLARGYSVDLVVANGIGDLADLVPEGVRVFDLESPRLIRALPGFVRYLRDHSPRVVISAEDHVNLVALIARRLVGSRVPISVSCHVLHSLSVDAPLLSRRGWTRSLIRMLYPWATARIAVSTGMADEMAEHTGLPRQSIDVLYNAIVTPGMEVQAAAECPHPWLRAGEPPVVLGVGRLRPGKGFDVLLQAFTEVRRVQPLRLVVLGEGGQRERLLALANELGVADDFDLPGHVPNPYAYMSRASLFVLSSSFEGLPGVLIQALACGCPVVSTDCRHGPREILLDGEVGPLVPVGDAPAMQKAMKKILDAPPDRASLRDRGQRFEVGRILDEYSERLGF